MSYKTILVDVDESAHVNERIKIAASLALSQDAHLIGVAMTGISRFAYKNGILDELDPNLVVHLSSLRNRAKRSLENFEPIVKKFGEISYEKRIIDDEASGGISLQARYSDLVVIGQFDPNEPSPTALSYLPEYVALNAGRPVLIIPYAGQFDSVGNRVLISWNGSREATRAVTDSIPLLKQAALVQLVVFNAEKESDAHGEQPGADIALYLARHGIKVEVSQHTTTMDIGTALLSLATDLNSDLLVLGCYGHSRFRETILGGVTRTILNSMTIPVLMSH